MSETTPVEPTTTDEGAPIATEPAVTTVPGAATTTPEPLAVDPAASTVPQEEAIPVRVVDPGVAVEDVHLPSPGTLLVNPSDICPNCGQPFGPNVDVHVDSTGAPVKVHTTCYPVPVVEDHSENHSPEELASLGQQVRANQIGVPLGENGELPEGLPAAQAQHIEGVQGTQEERQAQIQAVRDEESRGETPIEEPVPPTTTDSPVLEPTSPAAGSTPASEPVL